MPILDITFSTPLPSALIRLYVALSAVTPARSPLSIRSVGRLEGQVRVDRRGAVAEQQRGVVHLAHVAALDDEADPGAGLGCGSGGGARRW